MKMCIPIEENKGLKSKINNHFGSAFYFLIYDTDKKNTRIIDNTNRLHVHGMCHPLKVLKNQAIDAVFCRGMGSRAVQMLNEGGIKAYKCHGKSVEDIIDECGKGTLEEITVKNACTDHSCH